MQKVSPKKPVEVLTPDCDRLIFIDLLDELYKP